MTRLLTLVTLIIIGHVSPMNGQTSQVTRGQLLGAWRLTRVETIRANGDIYLPFGEQVTGTLAYLESSDMIVAWGRGDRPELKNPSSPTGTELLAIVRGLL